MKEFILTPENDPRTSNYWKKVMPRNTEKENEILRLRFIDNLPKKGQGNAKKQTLNMNVTSK